MSASNTSENFYYDSDEDVAWGPRTFREIKRDLKREKKIPPNYRRQTASFVPCTTENNSAYTLANSSHSSKDYFTANESLESNNIQPTEEFRANTMTTNYTADSCSDNYLTAQNKTATTEFSEVIALSSDSEYEDDNQRDESYNIKSERFSCSQKTNYNSFSIVEETSDKDVIYLSSSDDEESEPQKDESSSHALKQDSSMDSLEGEQTPKIQSIANTPVRNANYSLNQSIHQDSSFSNLNEHMESAETLRQTPRIRIIARTPSKKDSNASFIDGKQNSSFAGLEADISSQEIPETSIKHFNHSINQNVRSVTKSPYTILLNDDRHLSNDKIDPDTPGKELNYSSDNFSYRDHFLTEEKEKIATPKTDRHIPIINIISNTPIKGPNLISDDDNDNQEASLVDNYQMNKSGDSSKQSDDCIEIGDDGFSDRNSSESPSTNIQNNSFNNFPPISSNTSLHKSLNISQNENEYDYCEEINHTLSSKLELDLSLKDSDEVCNTSYGSATSRNLNISGVHSLPTNSSNDVKNDSLTSNEFNKTQNESINLNQSHNTCDDSVTDNQQNSCLNDTFAEMERLLTQGFDSDSDDSSEEIVDSTSCDHPRPAFGNSSIHNISRIPVAKSFSDESRSNTSIKSEFKIPQLPTKVIKKTPVNNRLMANKLSPIPLKNIISPVRLYINNSPVAALKQTNRPVCTKSLRTLTGISEGTICVPKKRRNLLDSLPAVVYKPSRLVREKCDDQIILPNNIRKLITERIVIKHEPRKRINPDESMYSVGDKLAMRDLSVIVSDDQNMSVHTTKQGFNL